MARLIRVPPGFAGTTTYTLAPSESWSLDAVVFKLTAASVGADRMPLLTFRDPSGHVIAKAFAPVFSI